MHLPAAGERAAQLPWLWPDAHSLAAIAGTLTSATWPILRRDPAALLLVHRRGSSVGNHPDLDATSPARFLEPRILETVLRWYQRDAGHWVDWRHPSVMPIYKTSLAIAHYARILASLTHCRNANAAWTAGLLAPLGWFAVAAVEPAAIAACCADPNFASDPEETQERHWGRNQFTIARQLAVRWELPDWLRLVIGHLDLPLRAAMALGTDAPLFGVVQMAALLAERAGYALRLIRGANWDELFALSQIKPSDLLAVEDRFQKVEFAEAFDPDWQDAREMPELFATFQSTINRRRAEASPFLEPLERDLNRLHKVVGDWRTGEEDRLRKAKLEALAEFAAGASHEINNPLAVISGQSQYLLKRNPDASHRRALESIVRQTERIHAILAELMQFARPPQIVRKRIDLIEVLNSVLESYRPMASETETELVCRCGDAPVWIEADVRYLLTAIGCLVRNAIEAASLNKGIVSARVERNANEVQIIIEDDGPGPTAEQREHMFDPFYSGRPAGRGRGLGLPTAWRLAHEHGGDVRHDHRTGGLTRFALTLPLPNAEQMPERKSA